MRRRLTPVVLVTLVLSLMSVEFVAPRPAGAATVGTGDCAQAVDDATGVTSVVDGADCVVTFTRVGTTVWTAPAGLTQVSVLVVAGGGGGGGGARVSNNDIPGGGGGAGGLVQALSEPVTAGTSVAITVGAGGAGGASSTSGSDGALSSFGPSLSAGGGGGGGAAQGDGRPGGSGGGAGGGNQSNVGGTGTVGIGNNGGLSSTGNRGAGGGGGAQTAGLEGAASFAPGAGGQGTTSPVAGGSTVFAVGGAGGPIIGTSSAGTSGSGSGGSGASGSGAGEMGGSGIVIVRYASAGTSTPTVPGSGDPVLAPQDLAACASVEHNGISVTPSHGSILYVDTGQSQNLDAGYLAYRVTSTAARADLWVQLEDFSGGVVSLADPSQAAVPLGSVAAGDPDPAFFLVKATGGTQVAQSHNVRVYRSDPRVGSPAPLYQCSFTLDRVDETIKAAANKVQSIAVTSAVQLGDTLTITVEGDSGTIGAGNTVDGRMIWVSPAARSSWPVGALRLETTTVTLFSDAGRTNVLSTHVDVLRINAATGLTGTNRQYYRGVYTFRVIGAATSVVPIVPAAMISSGTQVKHTDVNSLPKNGDATFTIDITSPDVKLTVAKTASTTIDSETIPGRSILSYSVTLDNTAHGAGAVEVDRVVDEPDSELTFVPGSATFNGAAIVNPATEDGRLVFSGPFSVAAGAMATISYRMSLPTCAADGTTSYQNTAFANIGTVIVGSTASTTPRVAVSIACADGTATATVTTDTEAVPPQVVTGSATEVTVSSATISGIVDPNGSAGNQVRFVRATTSDLMGATRAVTLLAVTTDATSGYAVSQSLSDLDANTTYFYRLEVAATTGADPADFIVGETRTFMTLAEPVLPVAVTLAPSTRTRTSATLEGTVNANRFAGGVRVAFEWALATDGSTAESCTPTGTTFSSGELLDPEDDSIILLDNGSPTPMSFVATGLEAATLHCARIVAISTTDASVDEPVFDVRTEGEWVRFATLTAQTLAVTAPTAPAPAVQIGDEVDVVASATSGLPVRYSSVDEGVCTIDAATGVVTTVGAGTCEITIAQSGDDTFEAAPTQTVSFVVYVVVQVTAATLAEGVYRQASEYSVTLAATGGDGSYASWTIVTGALPAGLTLHATTGVISGTPTAAGTAAFAVTVTSAGFASVARSFEIVIAKAPLTVTAPSVEVTFGDATPALVPEITTSELRGSDTTGSVFPEGAGLPTCSTGYVAGTPVASSPIATGCSGGLADNYMFTFVVGAISVARFPVTLGVVDTVKQENAADPTEFDVQFIPTLPTGQATSDVIPGGVTFTLSGSESDTADRTITPVAAGGPNYLLTLAAGTLSTTSLVIPTLQAPAISLTYGDDLTDSLGELNEEGGVQAAANGSPAAGTLVQRFATEIAGSTTIVAGQVYPAGEYTLEVAFTSTDGTVSDRTTTRTVTIAARPLTITASDAFQVLGMDDEPTPAPSVAYDGFISGQGPGDLTGTVSIAAAGVGTAGAWGLTPSGASSSNYAIAYVAGTLFIAGLDVSVEEQDGILVNRDVECGCAGLAPNSVAVLEILSEPTLIRTVGVDADGTCPGLAGVIPMSVEDGPHTLRITGVFPDGDRTAAVLTRPVVLQTPVDMRSDDRITGSDGAGDPLSGQDGDDTSTGGVSASEPFESSARTPILRRPTVSVPGGSAAGTPAGRAPVVVSPRGPTNGVATPPAGSGGVSGGQNGARWPLTALTAPGAVLSAAPATVDTGDGVRRASERPVATAGAGARSLVELANERLGGFDPVRGIRIEVLGSRTGARFVLSGVDRIDTVALVQAIERSMVAQAADFAAIDRVRVVASGIAGPTWTQEVRRDVKELFAAAGLPAPVALSELDASRVGTWVEVQFSATNYLPGSRVHLTVTSSPVVLASATVLRDGTVRIAGTLPIELLGAGEHRVRLVGIRSLGGVSVDASGDVQLTAATMAEIERFDVGTQATVAVIGSNPEGGAHLAVRVVPLEPVAPWWTLWLIALAFVAFVWGRRRGAIATARARTFGLVAFALSGLPAIVLGWLSTVTEVVWWGAGLSLLAAGVASSIRAADASSEGVIDDEAVHAPRVSGSTSH